MTEGVSMLDKLSAGIVDKKTKAASRGLTPLVGETIQPKATIPNHPMGVLPDDPDIILGRLAIARREVEGILASILHLEEMYGKPETIIPHEAEVTQALLDIEADRRAKDREHAAAGDKRAEARIEAEEPMAAVVTAAEGRLAKRAALLAAMLPGDASEGQKFEAHIKVIADEAQAEVFTAPAAADDTENEDPPEAAPAAVAEPVRTWLCPTHGKAITRTSPRGRQFNACTAPGCAEYERL